MRGEALADAEEFLLSEWEAVRRGRSSFTDHELYQHLVRKFGAPAQVAEGYWETASQPPLEDKIRGPAPLAKPKAMLRICISIGLGFALCGFSYLAAWSMGLLKDSNQSRQSKFLAKFRYDPKFMLSAGRVVYARRGPPSQSPYVDPAQALGPPDCLPDTKQLGSYFSLGRGGELVVEFTAGSLCDGPGFDLAIFEFGSWESVEVFLSNDGKTWTSLGPLADNTIALDLADYGLSGREFRFVRIVDAQIAVFHEPAYWGAEIDAIVALHARKRSP